jgi:uncharacterized LabA/DUF88 family protein
MGATKYKYHRVGVFIDAQNLYHSAKNLYQARVNFGNVLKDALAGRELIRAVAYVIRTESGEERAFFEALEKLGIEAKVKDLQVFFDGSKKADWDVGMAVDIIKLAPRLDTVIIASGDGDFVPLVEYLKANEAQVEVVAFGKSTSQRLRESADDFLDLCAKPGRYTLGRGRGRGRGRGGRMVAPATGTERNGE